MVFNIVYKIGITAGLTSIREVAALFSHTHGYYSRTGKVTRLISWRSYAADRQSVN